jgi:hypothetical protein
MEGDREVVIIFMWLNLQHLIIATGLAARVIQTHLQHHP